MSQTSAHQRLLVVHQDEMDKIAFTMHMSKRHLDSLAGLKDLPEDLDDYVEDCYRAFHYRLHATRIDLEHEHAA